MFVARALPGNAIVAVNKLVKKHLSRKFFIVFIPFYNLFDKSYFKKIPLGFVLALQKLCK